MNTTPELILVMPVYNEKDAIFSVVDQWITVLNRLTVSYELHIYNDGSTDSTEQALNTLKDSNQPVVIHNKTNSGHGPTILQGYLENQAEWIFQTDSDDEMPPAYFEQLWTQRQQYDFLIGRRMQRVSPLSRQIISAVSRAVVHTCYGRGVHDVNSPFRLMRSSFFATCFQNIPANTFAPNLIISGYACQNNARILEIDVPHIPRKSGNSSIQKWGLLKAAARSMLQTISCRNSLNRLPQSEPQRY